MNPAPSQLVNCAGLADCFQKIYNLFFAIFLALAFLYFLYGAFEYLLSGASITRKEVGRSKMVSSIVALIIVLVMPVIINIINPEIFKGAEVKLPRLIVEVGTFVEDIAQEIAAGTSPETLSKYYHPKDINTAKNHLFGPTGNKVIIIHERDLGRLPKSYEEASALGWSTKDLERKVKNIVFKNNNNKTEYINPILKRKVIELDQELQKYGIYVKFTDGFALTGHVSKAHTKYGTAFDLVVIERPSQTAPPVPTTSPKWIITRDILRSLGFYVLDERTQITPKWTAAHLHVFVIMRESRR